MACSMYEFYCQKVLPLVYDDSLSYYEVVCKLSDVVQEIAKQEDINGDQIASIIATYVSIADLENNRKLSATGDFTGTLNGKTLDCVFTSIADSLTLSKTLIDNINARIGIGGVYDGGNFTETDPPTLTIDGGEFYNLNPIMQYNVNCIRDDYKVRESTTNG